MMLLLLLLLLPLRSDVFTNEIKTKASFSTFCQQKL